MYNYNNYTNFNIFNYANNFNPLGVIQQQNHALQTQIANLRLLKFKRFQYENRLIILKTIYAANNLLKLTSDLFEKHDIDEHLLEVCQLKDFQVKQKKIIDKMQVQLQNVQDYPHVNNHRTVEHLRRNFASFFAKFNTVMDKIGEKNTILKAKLLMDHQNHVEIESAKFDELETIQKHYEADVMYKLENRQSILEQLTATQNKTIRSLIFAKKSQFDCHLPIEKALYLLRFENSLTFDVLFQTLAVHGQLDRLQSLKIPDNYAVRTHRTLIVRFKCTAGYDLHEFAIFRIHVNLVTLENFRLLFLKSYFFCTKLNLLQKFCSDQDELELKEELTLIFKMVREINPDLPISLERLMELRSDALLMEKSILTTRTNLFEIFVKIFFEDENYVRKRTLAQVYDKATDILQKLNEL